MSHRRWISSRRVRLVPLLAGTAAVLAFTAACGDGTTTGSSQPQGSSSPLTTTLGKPSPSGSASPTTGNGAPLTISDEAGKQLCDMLRPQLSDWRVQGPTLGKISLNASVHEWALRNGGINLQVLGDKDVIDRVTTKNCSDVRDQAISALEIPNLASGLAG
ncbi:hypothetical protein OHB26_21900 [Nocardia sp. NBC_01503]|uniref:hypothetical protein n=1 Tax=Nocardia sp. NBC_01503 TaxID=2975997 RepID=UPI002E7BF641|nr:hypothetical protein [Nocardia sp. NBC_01503]WTL29635.1 hypothetical protein OHB26_21900 [Nocardia sp. NBC_01503]